MSRSRLIPFVLVLAGLLLLAGCNVNLQSVTGSGTVVTREFDFSDFNAVDLAYAFQGNITQGDDYRVVVRVDDNLEEFLVAEQNGDRVTIGLKEGTVVSRATMEVDITMPALRALNASGASQATISGFDSGDDFRGEASGASRIEGDITTGDATLNASGASTIRLSGAAGDVRAEASGASTVDLEAMTAANADAEASGASRVTVNTDGRLDANASGASTVSYVGNPTMGTIEESGGSNVRQQ